MHSKDMHSVPAPLSWPTILNLTGELINIPTAEELRRIMM
uniref:Uncharacterized protein n=1 Tax=Anguilla anguilla TaxID=7936 RepID=A0A0E9STK3_ANGAN